MDSEDRETAGPLARRTVLNLAGLFGSFSAVSALFGGYISEEPVSEQTAPTTAQSEQSFGYGGTPVTTADDGHGFGGTPVVEAATATPSSPTTDRTPAAETVTETSARTATATEEDSPTPASTEATAPSVAGSGGPSGETAASSATATAASTAATETALESQTPSKLGAQGYGAYGYGG